MRLFRARVWVSLLVVCMLAAAVHAQQAIDPSAPVLPKPDPGYEWVLITQDDGTKLPQQVRVVSKSTANQAQSAPSNPVSPPATTTATTNTTKVGTSNSVQPELQKKITSINLDRPLGSAAAFVALDVSPETVTHPSSPRELAAGLLNGVDHNGVLQTGLAIEVAPFQIFHRGNYNIDDYNASDFSGISRRILYNTSLSLATTKATSGDDKAQRLGLGAHFTSFL